MVALGFISEGGRMALPPGYPAGKTLMNNLAESPVLGTELVLRPYQAILMELKKN
jgi:hypothetical protein